MLTQKYIEFEITTRCNLRCSYCLPLTVGGAHGHQDMSVERFRTIIAQCQGLAPLVMFKGLAEPLLHRQLGDLLTIAKEHGFRVFICTNLTLPRFDVLRRADGLLISIDSLEDGPWNQRGGNPRLVADNLLELVRDRGALNMIHIYTVAHRKNLDQLAGVFDFAASLGDQIDWLFVGPVLDSVHPENMLTEEELGSIKRLMSKYKDLRFKGPLVQDPPTNCGWLTHLFYITVDGRLAVCSVREPLLQERFAQLEEVGIRQQLKSPELVEFKRQLDEQDLDDVCRSCVHSGITGCFHSN